MSANPGQSILIRAMPSSSSRLRQWQIITILMAPNNAIVNAAPIKSIQVENLWLGNELWNMRRYHRKSFPMLQIDENLKIHCKIEATNNAMSGAGMRLKILT